MAMMSRSIFGLFMKKMIKMKTYPSEVQFIKTIDWPRLKDGLLAEGWKPVCTNALMTSVPTIMLERAAVDVDQTVMFE